MWGLAAEIAGGKAANWGHAQSRGVAEGVGAHPIHNVAQSVHAHQGGTAAHPLGQGYGTGSAPIHAAGGNLGRVLVQGGGMVLPGWARLPFLLRGQGGTGHPLHQSIDQIMAAAYRAAHGKPGGPARGARTRKGSRGALVNINS
jgi:hypothetical protein